MTEAASQISPELVRLVKRSRFNPIRNLTPDLLSRQLDSFATGYLRDFALTAEAIAARDDVITVALAKREKAPARRPYVIQLNDGLEKKDMARAEEHKASLKFFYDHLTATHALDQNQRGGFRLLARQMMKAVPYRYAVHEIIWSPRVDLDSGKARLTATFNFVPLQFFENTIGRLRFLPTYFGGIEGKDMEQDNWLVTVGEGIMEPLSIAYMFKQLSLKDWVSYSEKFGTPGLLGKTSAAKDSPGWDALADALENFSQDWAAVCNTDASIDLIEAKGSGSLPFAPLVERMDRAISTICRGADLSTMSAGQGQGQGASVQGEESELLEQDDAAMLSETLMQISRVVIRELFGDEEPLAFVEIVVPKKKNSADTRDNVKLLVDCGVPIGQTWAQSEFGIPSPTADEPVLSKPAAPSPFGGPPQVALANAASTGRDAIFRAESLKKLSAAQAESLKPLTSRLSSIEGIADEAEQDAALVKLQSDLPKLYRQIAGDPATAKAFEEILGAALVSGATEGAKAKTKN